MEVRHWANGEIVTEELPLARMSEQYKIFRYPVFRGVGTLYQAMKLGIKALQFSTNAAMQDLPPEQRKDGSVKEPPKKNCNCMWAMAPT